MDKCYEVTAHEQNEINKNAIYKESPDDKEIKTKAIYWKNESPDG